MPGKVNPVICESLIQVCAKVIGNDTAITLGGLGGSFQLNTMLPLIAYNVLESIQLLNNSINMFREKLIVELSANKEICNIYIEGSLAMCRSLAPVIGYDKAAAIAHHAHVHNTTLKDACVALGHMTAEEFTAAVIPEEMI